MRASFNNRNVESVGAPTELSHRTDVANPCNVDVSGNDPESAATLQLAQKLNHSS